jgi:hypothetical protein
MAVSLLHSTDVGQIPNEASGCRNIHAASNDPTQLVVLPFVCLGIAVAVDGEQFWQGYRIMSGIIVVLLAMEILMFEVVKSRYSLGGQ